MNGFDDPFGTHPPHPRKRVEGSHAYKWSLVFLALQVLLGLPNTVEETMRITDRIILLILAAGIWLLAIVIVTKPNTALSLSTNDIRNAFHGCEVTGTVISVNLFARIRC